MIIRLRHCYPIIVTAQKHNRRAKPTPGGGCSHGPVSTYWPWWKHMAFLFCRLGLDPRSPSSGWRLWTYTRRGAWSCDLIIDRRPK